MVRVLRLHTPPRPYPVHLLHALLALLLLVRHPLHLRVHVVLLRLQVAAPVAQRLHRQQRLRLLRLTRLPLAHLRLHLRDLARDVLAPRLHRLQVLARVQLLLQRLQRLLRLAQLRVTAALVSRLLSQLPALQVDALQRLLRAVVGTALLVVLLVEGVHVGGGLLQVALLLRDATRDRTTLSLHLLQVRDGLTIILHLLLQLSVVVVDGLLLRRELAATLICSFTAAICPLSSESLLELLS